jgi:glycosyltransferase involved in cell wall biosynthesis
VLRSHTPTARHKVMVVSGSAYTLGGMERAMQRLGRGLPEHGYEVEVVIPAGDSAARVKQWFAELGTPAIISHELAALSSSRWGPLPEFVRFLRKRAPALVNVHSPGCHVPLAEALAARLAGARVVTSIHGFNAGSTGQVSQRLRNVALGSKLNAKVVAPSRLVMEQQLLSGMPASKVEMIRYGVEIPRLMPERTELRRRLGIAAEASVIVALGRLVPDKGIDTLIRAVQRMTEQQRVGLKVLIGGVGGHQREYESMLTDRDREIVSFVGHVTETGAYYAASDLFVLPSRHEPFGLVFAEAAQYGIPSVGTRTGGIAEAIEDQVTGLLVPPEDPASLRDAILTLLRDDQRRLDMGMAARERARSLFGEEAMVAAYARLFESVAAGSSTTAVPPRRHLHRPFPVRPRGARPRTAGKFPQRK